MDRSIQCRCNAAPGFTLFELMVVVTIMGVMMALAAPSLSVAMQDRKGAEAAYRIVAVYKIARSRALMSGRAHMASFTGGTGGAGRFEVWQSDQFSSCTRTVWPALPAIRRIALLDLNDGDFANNGVRVDAITPGGATGDICYTPLGQMWYRASSAGAWNDGTAIVGGGFDLMINRYEGGDLSGPTRHVLIPFGGIARVRL